MFDRRHFLRTGTAAVTVSVSGWLGRLARAAAPDPARKRSCVLLWLHGGPATIGPQFAPLIVADGQGTGPGRGGADVDRQLRVQDLDHFGDVNRRRADDRLALMRDLEADFLASRAGAVGASHRAAYDAAVRLMK